MSDGDGGSGRDAGTVEWDGGQDGPDAAGGEGSDAGFSADGGVANDAGVVADGGAARDAGFVVGGGADVDPGDGAPRDAGDTPTAPGGCTCDSKGDVGGAVELTTLLAALALLGRRRRAARPVHQV